MFRTAITMELDHLERDAYADLVPFLRDALAWAAEMAEAVTIEGFTIELADVPVEEVERSIPYLVQVSYLENGHWRAFTARGSGGGERFIYEGPDLGYAMFRVAQQLHGWEEG